MLFILNLLLFWHQEFKVMSLEFKSAYLNSNYM